jgi:hypothetical protein
MDMYIIHIWQSFQNYPHGGGRDSFWSYLKWHSSLPKRILLHLVITRASSHTHSPSAEVMNIWGFTYTPPTHLPGMVTVKTLPFNTLPYNTKKMYCIILGISLWTICKEENEGKNTVSLMIILFLLSGIFAIHKSETYMNVLHSVRPCTNNML